MPDPIHIQVRRQMGEIERKFLQPVGVVFSNQGYLEANREAVGAGTQTFDSERRTYMGLPYRIDPRQQTAVKVLDQEQVQGGVIVRVPYPSVINQKQERDTVLIGRAMTKAQVCDVVVAWCEANPGDSLEDAFRAAVAKHGEFE